MRKRSRLPAYALAVMANALALLASVKAPSIAPPPIVLLLAATVLASAWMGGLGPGLVSTVLGGAVLALSALPAVPDAPAGNLLATLLFVILGAGVSLACGARERAETGRRQNEERFRALLGAEVVGIAFCDREAVQEANDAFLGLMGYSREALDADGFRWRETAPDSRYLDERALRQLIATGRCTPFEKEHQRPDGSRVTLLIGAALLERQPLRWVCFAVDLTEQKRIPQLGQLLTAELDVRKIAQGAIDAATVLTGARFGAFFASGSDAGGQHALLGLSGAPREVFGRVGLPRSTPLLAPTLVGGRLVRLDDATKDPRYGQTAPHFGMPRGHLPLRSYLAVPVVSRTGALHGAVLLGHPETAVFAERDERIVLELARHAAVALDGARRHSELAHALKEEEVARAAVSQRARLEALGAEVGMALTRPEDRRTVLQRCAEATVRHLDAALARIWTCDTGGNELALQASAGVSGCVEGGDAHLPAGCSEIGLIATQRRPLVIDWPGEDPRVPERDSTARDGMIAFAGFPLLVDDRLIGIMAILAPAPFPAGSAERMVAIAATIASDLDRRRREEEASELLARERQARAAAEATSARKDEFLARVGYELRHPLTTIRDVLAAGVDEEHRVRVLEVARRRVEQVAELVEDLPDVAAITQGTIELHRERVSVAEVIERGLERARLPHDDGDPVLSVSLPPERLELDADPVRLEQMVATLLESVARDSEPGSRIEILVEREAGEAVLRVRNPEMTPGPRPDLGLGPIVVRKLVELHGGRVEWLGDGRSVDAEVIVRLPALARTEVRMERAIGRARVLLVDDNLDAATSLATLLGLLGHEVEVVHDGPAALAAARTNAPDVALVDIGLPGMDGYAVARRMRERSGKKVMLVALTGYGSEEDRERALAAGFDHHLVKPVDLDTLEGLVAELGAGTSARSKPSSLH